MTDFALIVWIFSVCLIEKAHRSRIERLEKTIKELKQERRVVIDDDIERLAWYSLSLPEGSHAIDEKGVREVSEIPVLTFIPKNK